MTSATKYIWTIVMINENKEYSKTSIFKYAAYDLPELLTYFNTNGQKSIIKIERSEEKVTYMY